MAAEDAAVSVTLRANLKDYEAALKSAVRSTERAAKAAEAAVSGIGKQAQAAPIAAAFQKSAGQMANDARVLQYQLNDIFSGVASGQGIRAVQMQLGQIAQQLGGGGLVAGARTMGAALVGMINPINLAVVAFGVLATAAASWFAGSEEEAKAAKKELEEHKRLLSDIKGRWGEMLPGVGAYIDEIDRASNALQKMLDQQNLIKEAQVDLTALLRSNISTVAELTQLLEATQHTDLANTVQAAFAAYRAEIAAGRQGTAELIKLREALAKANATGVEGVTALVAEITNKLAPVLRKTEEDVRKIQRAFGEMPQSMGGIGAPTFPSGVPSAPGALGDIMRREQIRSGTGAEQLQFLKTKAASQEIADQLDAYGEEAIRAFVELFSILPESARITSAARSFGEQAKLRSDWLTGRGGLAAPPETGRHVAGGGRVPTAIDVGQGVSMEELRQAVAQVEKLEQLKGRAYQIDKVHVQLAGTQRRLDDEAAQAAERQAQQMAQAQENLADYLVSLDEQASLQVRINQINTNAALTEDQKKIAIEVETELQRAMNLAQQNSITLTEQQIEQIRRKAVANAQAKIGADAVAAAERDAARASQEQADASKQLAQQMTQMAQSAVGGLINDLRNGVEAGDAFNNMLNRILDSLIQMSLQSLFSPTGLGAIFGGLAGVKHGGGLVEDPAPMRMVPRNTFVGAQRYAKGGFAGLRAGEVPIIAHRGELIIPKGMMSRMPAGAGETTINNQPSIRIDMRRDVVTGSTQDAKKLGEEMNKAIQVVLVRESRPGGLLRRTP